MSSITQNETDFNMIKTAPRTWVVVRSYQEEKERNGQWYACDYGYVHDIDQPCKCTPHAEQPNTDDYSWYSCDYGNVHDAGQPCECGNTWGGGTTEEMQEAWEAANPVDDYGLEVR